MGRINGKQLCRVDGSALDRFHGSHSVFHHQNTLIAGQIILIKRSAGIGAEGNFHTGLMSPTERILVSLDGIFNLADHIVRDSGSCSMNLDPVGSGQSGNKEDIVLFHEIKAPVIHEETMLDGVNACAEGIFDSFHSLGMGEGFCPGLVGLFNGSPQFLFCQLGRTRLYAFCHNAAGGHNFDPGSACF